MPSFHYSMPGLKPGVSRFLVYFKTASGKSEQTWIKAKSESEAKELFMRTIAPIYGGAEIDRVQKGL